MSRTLTMAALVAGVAGVAFIADNYWYMSQHPLPASGHAATPITGTPPMPVDDAQKKVVYKELEDRLKAIRHAQKTTN